MILYLAGFVILAFVFTSNLNRGKSSDANPQAYFGIPYEEVAFPSSAKDKITLRGWWLPQKDSKRVLVLVHGIYNDKVQMLAVAWQLWLKNYNILLFDLRAHGKSDGDRVTYGNFEQYDVVGAVEFVKSKGFEQIAIVAQSLGASSSLLAMSSSPDIKAAVLDSPFGDFGRVARKQLGGFVFLYPMTAFTAQLLWDFDPNQVKPENAFANLGNRRVLLIHGIEDGLIPVSEAYNLKKIGSKNIAETWILPGLGHAVAYGTYPDEYVRKVTLFLDRELK